MAPNRDPELLAAISEAVDTTPLQDDFDESWSSWGDPTEQTGDESATAPGAAPGESQTQTAEGPVEPVASTEPTEAVEPPTEFWGVDLSDIPAEARAAILSKLEQQEGTIHKLQARLAEERTPEPVVAQEEEELSDEDILAGLGIDPEDYSVTAAQKDAMLRMARATMALEERVEQMYNTEQVRQVQTAWNNELDALEAKHGKLPGNRVQVLQYAVEEGITDPAGLYFRLTAEPRQEIDKAVAEARRQALQTEARGGVAPRSTNAGTTIDLKGLSMKDAITAAAKAAEKESGLKWKDSIKRVVTSPTGFQGS